MTSTDGAHDQVTTTTRRLEHLRWMILARSLDQRMVKLKEQGLVAGSVFTGRGQEAFSAAGGMWLRPGDVFAPLIRDQAGRLAFGEEIVEAVRSCLGKRTGSMRGRDGNVHRGHIARGLLPMISHLGAMISVVTGVLLARRLKGELVGDDLPVGMAAIGDGGMSSGALHEGLNAAAVEKLPLVLMVTNNQVAYSTFNDRQFACRDLIDRAIGYGVGGHSCDGTNAKECLRAMHQAVSLARRGEGPQMVVATLLRLDGHGHHDDASYVTAAIRARFGDCIPLAEAALIAEGIADVETVQGMWDQAREAITRAIEQVKPEPEPDPEMEEWSAYSVRDLKGVRS